MAMGEVWNVGLLVMYISPVIDNTAEIARLLVVHAARDVYRLSVGYNLRYAYRRRGEAVQSLSLSWVTMMSGLWILRQIHQKCRDYQSQCDDFIQELQRQKKQLSDKNKYIATLTHEMRNIATRYS